MDTKRIVKRCVHIFHRERKKSLSEHLLKMPKRFQWTIHNLVAHPVMEILFQFGFVAASNRIHEATTPAGGTSHG